VKGLEARWRRWRQLPRGQGLLEEARRRGLLQITPTLSTPGCPLLAGRGTQRVHLLEHAHDLPFGFGDGRGALQARALAAPAQDEQRLLREGGVHGRHGGGCSMVLCRVSGSLNGEVGEVCEVGAKKTPILANSPMW
jgi:hypothetical protein